ncbi:MAG: hypothetical protein IT170_18455, partial [Bryobacterales bacterium]|nr:hypothetical protein [Bryobacterales bacterium]
MQVITPECYVRSDVQRLVDYRNPNDDYHKRKAAGRDPNGFRSPQPEFWKGCVHFAHRGLAGADSISDDQAQSRFVELALPTLCDVRGRVRPRTIKLGIYNPPSDFQAKLRALPPAVRTELVSEAFREFQVECAKVFQGPMITWSHPDKIRMHFEKLALLYESVGRRKYNWAKGLRADGAGTTTYAELEHEHPWACDGFNSRIAGNMARFFRDRFREIELKMNESQREAYERNVRLQHVILELTMHEHSQRNRIRRGHHRPLWLERLVRAWAEAPGDESIEHKINSYREIGLIDSRGIPCVIPAMAKAGSDYLRIVAEAKRSPGSSGPLPPSREAWLDFWIRMLRRERRRKGYLKQKRIEAASWIFQRPRSPDDVIQFAGEVFE